MSKQYRISGIIGKGAAGTVYLVKDVNGTSYALKMIDNYKDRFIKQMVENQIKTQKIFQGSAYIIQIIGTQKINNSICLVLELGQCSLRHWVDAYMQISESDILTMVCNVCEGLQLIHSKNVFHRDIKPQNIIKKDKFYKISDFGSANVAEQNYIEAGTPIYWPPQILLHEQQRITNKVDVWSFGVTVFQVYFKINPFCPQKQLKQINSHKKLIAQMLNNISQLTPNFSISKLINVLNRKKLTQQSQFIIKKCKNTGNTFIDVLCSIFEPNPDNRPTIPQLLKSFQYNKSCLKIQNLPKTQIRPQFQHHLPQDIAFMCITKDMIYQCNHYYPSPKNYQKAILGLQLEVLLLQNCNYQSTFYMQMDKKQQLKIYRDTSYQQAQYQVRTLLSQYYFYLVFDQQVQNYNKIIYLRFYILLCSVWRPIMRGNINFCKTATQIFKMQIDYPLRVLQYDKMFSVEAIRSLEEKLVEKFYVQ